MTLSLSLTAYSQHTAFVTDEGDTLVCLTPSEARYLLKAHYAREICDSIITEQKRDLAVKDSTLTVAHSTIEDRDNLIQNYADRLALTKAKEQSLERQLDEALESNANLKHWNKGLTWTAGIFGVAALTFFGFHAYGN